jgi:hypothetical protein
MFTLYRNYVNHEDNLTNNRLSWNFTIQGFLFIAWAYCQQHIISIGVAQSQPNLGLSYTLRYLREATVVVGRVGFFVSLLTWFGTLASSIAIFKLSLKWTEEHEVSCSSRKSVKSVKKELSLPELTGGGSEIAHWMGLLAPIFVPIVFVVAWGYLILSFR